MRTHNEEPRNGLIDFTDKDEGLQLVLQTRVSV